MSADREALLMGWMHDDLDRVDRVRLAVLLDSDPRARAELASHEALHRWLRAGAAELPVERIMAAVRSAPPPRAPRRPWWLGGVATAIAIGLAAAAVLHRPLPTAGPAPQRTERAAPRLVIIAAAADGTADAGRPGFTDATAPLLRVTSPDRGAERAACVRFSVPSGLAIHRARLLVQRSSGAGAVLVRLAIGAWEEATLRWYHVPAPGRRLGLIEAGAEAVELPPPGAGELSLLLTGEPGTDAVFTAREAGGGGPRLELELAGDVPAAAPPSSTVP